MEKPILRPLCICPSSIRYLDQTLLPEEERYIDTNSFNELIDAIKRLAIRGAPLLGLAGICGLFLSALSSSTVAIHVDNIERLKQARPTAIQLSSILAACYEKSKHLSLQNQKEVYYHEAIAYEQQLINESFQIISHALPLIKKTKSILTHCNTGTLAMGGWGTALGIIIYTASCLKHKLKVYYTETRPLQQGLRLTRFELNKNNVPAFCLVDSAVAYLMKMNLIDAVIVGADRIASNGDTANKIGTYMLALSAKVHHIPFYVAAPTSTIDYDIKDSRGIPVEYRSKNELTENTRCDFEAFNPAFDITPGELITAFITEKGLLSPPFQIN